MIINGGPVLCKCGNAARYMNERGELCCSICPLKEGIDSIKLDDVPQLLAWARKFIILHGDHPWHQSLREIVQRCPVVPPVVQVSPTNVTPDWWGKCKCYRPGWLEGHDDPKCEYRT